MVHPDVADTVDSMLRGDPVAPELRWRDEGGVHRSQARPRPGPQSQLPGERFGGLVGAGSASFGGGWRTEPGWRPDARPFEQETGRGYRPGYRPGASGGWRRGPNGGASGGDPFRQGEVADRGPLERGTPLPEARARDLREFDRQREWRDSAAKAITALRAEETHGGADDDELADLLDDELEASEEDELTGERRPTLLPAPGDTSLPTLRVLGFGVSNKRLEQAVRELGLPVTLVRDAEEADTVITLRNYYKQKAPALREAEERGLPIFVLKSNTMVQMESALTSIFALEVDPRDAALREVEEAIGLVTEQAKPVELSPQNAYIRRLQHQMAERANLVSHSRGREPYRRVRLYPDSSAPRIRRKSG
jgi:hypothetical protein